METEEKERILQEAGGLFLKYGVRSVSMDDIARELGMSKKTLYQFYSGKDDLVGEFLSVFMQSQERKADEIRDSSDNVIDELKKISAHMREQINTINPSFVYDLKKYHPKPFQQLKEHKKQFAYKCMVESLERGIEQGYFRKEINPKILSRIRMEEVELGYDQELFPPEQFSVPQVQVELFYQFIYGIATIKGHQEIDIFREEEQKNNN